MIGNLLRKILCSLSSHDWTSAVQQGIPPTQQQIDAGVDGYYDYATMYCRRCGYVSELSKRRSL
ncbi:hypothetical protein KAR91_08050 [Candidatus Pacearchaeota archaeon]|nr:hypothetical protein [Candidatus Pacearchaeota archaeon]